MLTTDLRPWYPIINMMIAMMITMIRMMTKVLKLFLIITVMMIIMIVMMLIMDSWSVWCNVLLKIFPRGHVLELYWVAKHNTSIKEVLS